jgi:hypothetical protein
MNNSFHTTYKGSKTFYIHVEDCTSNMLAFYELSGDTIWQQ